MSCKRVPSPCIRECCLDEHNVCFGCHRSLREICDWSDATDADRLEILERCTQRREQRERDRAVAAEHGAETGCAAPLLVSPAANAGENRPSERQRDDR